MDFTSFPEHYRGGAQRVTMLEECRRLRREATRSDRILWACLRRGGLGGLKFRRQHQFGPFILDFYCPELALNVELDGGIHNSPEIAARDHNRDCYLRAAGVAILRIDSEGVARNTSRALDLIGRACRERREQLDVASGTIHRR